MFLEENDSILKHNMTYNSSLNARINTSAALSNKTRSPFMQVHFTLALCQMLEQLSYGSQADVEAVFGSHLES